MDRAAVGREIAGEHFVNALTQSRFPSGRTARLRNMGHGANVGADVEPVNNCLQYGVTDALQRCARFWNDEFVTQPDRAMPVPGILLRVS